MDADEPLIEAIRSVATALDSLVAPSMIIGGIAVIAAGDRARRSMSTLRFSDAKRLLKTW